MSSKKTTSGISPVAADGLGRCGNRRRGVQDVYKRQQDYQHHLTGEDNADAHLKRMILGHQVLVPVTNGKLDLGPWERVHYGEFDGRRNKRVLLKAFGLP